MGQAQNGLRHNDYSRYRVYCARRLTHIRHAPDVAFTYGKGKKFVQRELRPEDVKQDRHLQIPLINAERAWATAMEEKSDADGADTADGRHRVLGRLKKAAKWAAELRSLAAARADGHTVLEAEAYAAWMTAQLELERGVLEAALAALVAARQIYEQLGRLSGRRQRELFEQRLEEMAPQERQCRYNLSRRKGVSVAAAARGAAAAGDASASLRPDLLAALADGRRGGGSGGGAVFWRRTVLAVQSDALRTALLTAQARSAQLSAQLAAQQQPLVGGDDGVASAAATLSSTSSSSSEPIYLDVLTKYDAAAKIAVEEATRAAREGKVGGACGVVAGGGVAVSCVDVLSALQPAIAADYKAIEEYCQFLKLRHALDRSVYVHAAAVRCTTRAGSCACCARVLALLLAPRSCAG